MVFAIVIKKKRNRQYDVSQKDQSVEISTYNTPNPIYNNESETKFMEEKGNFYDLPQTEKKDN